MDDLFHALLTYLKKFPLDYIHRPINDFLTTLGYKEDSLEDAQAIKSTITALEQRKFIDSSVEPALWDLFGEKYHSWNEETGKHDKPTNGTLKIYKLEARLLSEGNIYMDKRNREIRQAESVIKTNLFSRVSMGATLLLSIVVISIQLVTCNRDKAKDLRELHKENTDAQSQRQLQKNVEAVNQRLQEISLSLKDTSTKKIKIVKK